MAAYIERKAGEGTLQSRRCRRLHGYGAAGATAALGKTMEPFSEDRGYMLQSNAEFRARIHHMMGG